MSDFDHLRQLLLGEERAKLGQAEQRIAELERINRELAAHLPGLVKAAPTEPMSRALATPVAAALGNAVQQNRASIVDALFPVIGPIIRKAIAEALRGMMRDLNQVLEHGFSPRGIRWRIEAWRSGVPFAQIVLRHSLRYQVDHVFLIERDSGLVLQRASSPGLPDLDADAIAGMLTAIGQFVRDSVGPDGTDSLEAARVGEHLLWVLDGPRATLACFIRGVPPDALRVVLSDRLERLHAQMADADDEASWRAMLQEPNPEASLDPVDLLKASATMAGDDAAPRRPRASRWPMAIILLLIFLAIGWQFSRVHRWNAHVDDLRKELLSHPGFLLSGIESRAWQRLSVQGLLDADAEPLQPLLDRGGFGEVTPELAVSGFVSTDDVIVLRRAERLLAPPQSVELSVDGGVLAVDGKAAADWIAQRRSEAAWVSGVRAVDWRVMPLTDEVGQARAALGVLSTSLATQAVTFVRDVEPDADSETRLEEIAALLKQAAALAVLAEVTLQLRIDGYNDAPGSSELNSRLRQQRAEWLRDRLREREVPAALLDAAEVAASSATDVQLRGAKVHLTTQVSRP